jgi:cytochrome c556
MTDLMRLSCRKRHRRIAAALTGIGLTVGLLGTSIVASGQEQSSVTPKDVIFARKILMATIANSMYPIDQMLQTEKVDLDTARHHADAIAGMLTAFPHLFPPTTNTWTPNAPRDPATDTFAAPAIWQSFEFFYKESEAAAEYAYDASQAQNADEFKKYARQLRLTCDGCHATYQKNN